MVHMPSIGIGHVQRIAGRAIGNARCDKIARPIQPPFIRRLPIRVKNDQTLVAHTVQHIQLPAGVHYYTARLIEPSAIAPLLAYLP